VQSPVSGSQSVAPQGASVEQGPAQQCPLPATPQYPCVQSSFSLQGPTGSGVTHTPALQLKPFWHSALELHLGMHAAPASSQSRL
jgi:hypothetical protein